MSFLSGFSVGSNVLMASKRGAQDKVALRQVFSVSVLLALILGVLFCALGLMCSDCFILFTAFLIPCGRCAVLCAHLLSFPSFCCPYDNNKAGPLSFCGSGFKDPVVCSDRWWGCERCSWDAVALIVSGWCRWSGLGHVHFSRSSISVRLPSRFKYC